MEGSTSTAKKTASTASPTEAEPRLSQQAQFSTYAEAEIPEGEQQNPPSGHQVIQTPGVAHEGPVENPLAKAKGN